MELLTKSLDAREVFNRNKSTPHRTRNNQTSHYKQGQGDEHANFKRNSQAILAIRLLWNVTLVRSSLRHWRCALRTVQPSCVVQSATAKFVKCRSTQLSARAGPDTTGDACCATEDAGPGAQSCREQTNPRPLYHSPLRPAWLWSR